MLTTLTLSVPIFAIASILAGVVYGLLHPSIINPKAPNKKGKP